MKRKKVYLVPIGVGAFKEGVPGEVIGVELIAAIGRESEPWALAYRVRWDDGNEESYDLLDIHDVYSLYSFDELDEGKHKVK